MKEHLANGEVTEQDAPEQNHALFEFLIAIRPLTELEKDIAYYACILGMDCDEVGQAVGLSRFSIWVRIRALKAFFEGKRRIKYNNAVF